MYAADEFYDTAELETVPCGSQRRNIRTGQFASVHGKKHTKLYHIWCAMKERCSNEHNKSYKHYGARGIKVCQEWETSFPLFEKWSTENGFSEHLTIDRINNEGNYCPENCRWVSTKEQNRNYRRNRFLTYQGETLCLKDMAEKHGINVATLAFRLKSGKSVNDALSNIDGRTLRWKTQIISKH